MALFLDVRAKEIKVFEDKVFNSFCDFFVSTKRYLLCMWAFSQDGILHLPQWVRFRWAGRQDGGR